MRKTPQELNSTNFLELFDDSGNPLLQKITDLLGVSKQQVAKTLGLSNEQISLDLMPEVTKGEIMKIANTLEFVARVFAGNRQKVLFWLKTPNPHFGGASPREMIIKGKQRKIHAFVLAAMGRESSLVV